MTIGDFSTQAAAYERSRPDYPDSLIDTLVSEASLGPGDSVIEFGAGTGILTRQLVLRGLRTIAIEPNEVMTSMAKVPQATWIKGSFEECPLPDESQAWAVAAQAFHWADPRRALPEVHRILKPRSLFSVIWNNRAVQESPILTWTEDLIRRIVPEFEEAYRNRQWDAVLQSTGHFEFLSRHTELHFVTMNQERFLELWNSHNRLNTIAGLERFQIFYDELLEYLQLNQIDDIKVPYHCQSWSVRRIE